MEIDVHLEVPEPWEKWILKQLEEHSQYWPYFGTFFAKEKFGELRVHYGIPFELYDSIPDEMYNELENFVEFLERGCGQICSVCGSPAAKIANIKGWLLTVCKEHGG